MAGKAVEAVRGFLKRIPFLKAPWEVCTRALHECNPALCHQQHSPIVLRTLHRPSQVRHCGCRLQAQRPRSSIRTTCHPRENTESALLGKQFAESCCRVQACCQSSNAAVDCLTRLRPLCKHRTVAFVRQKVGPVLHGSGVELGTAVGCRTQIHRARVPQATTDTVYDIAYYSAY